MGHTTTERPPSLPDQPADFDGNTRNGLKIARGWTLVVRRNRTVRLTDPELVTTEVTLSPHQSVSRGGGGTDRPDDA